MMKSLLIIGSAFTLAGCVAAPESGIRDPARFQAIAERVEILSREKPRDVARCFEENAALLPMTSFIRQDAVVTYRLRGFGFTFEEIEFAPGLHGGAIITTKLAPGVNRRWREDFERDRFSIVVSCAVGEPALS